MSSSAKLKRQTSAEEELLSHRTLFLMLLNQVFQTEAEKRSCSKGQFEESDVKSMNLNIYDHKMSPLIEEYGALPQINK